MECIYLSLYVTKAIIISIYVFNRAERRRGEARRETFTTPKRVTTRRSILGLPAKGRPGPSGDNDDNCDGGDDHNEQIPPVECEDKTT